jgi:hypothetical protein
MEIPGDRAPPAGHGCSNDRRQGRTIQAFEASTLDDSPFDSPLLPRAAPDLPIGWDQSFPSN